ncbi:olfactory receptor 14A16-like [Zootoca vivipara]|uniref:olfactory receptor 14A16-like n=1 Tax=Zootoca vivipara TaxID=8524 RepID=UPI00293BAB1F|nr:olfactory receptor 14A16-like [Zootoca vivipara]
MNLAMMDLGTISVMVPKSMAVSLLNSRFMSYSGCVAQVFFSYFFGTSDLALLTIMAHDRYVAICNPLQYELIMNRGACMWLVAIVWIMRLLNATLHAGCTFANTFCSNAVNQFFCEIPRLLKLSCTDFYLVEVGFLVLGWSIGLGCFIFIIITYVQIFSTVRRIPSVHGQKKALSTCLPHLMCLCSLEYLLMQSPPTDAASNVDIAFAVVYTIIPPTLNPFIYSMSNKEIKTAMWKLLFGILLKIYFEGFLKNGIVYSTF